MTDGEIIALALAHGFTLREQPDGSMDLNPYVHDFARALRAEVISEIRPLVDELRLMVNWRTHNAAVRCLRELVRDQ